MSLAVYPTPFVSCTILPNVCSYPIALTIFELPFINIPIFVFYFPRTFKRSFVPLSLVPFTPLPLINPIIVNLIIFEVTIVLISIREIDVTIAVFLPMLVGPFEKGSIRALLQAVTVLFSILPTTLVDGTVLPNENPLAVEVTIFKMPFVNISVWKGDYFRVFYVVHEANGMLTSHCQTPLFFGLPNAPYRFFENVQNVFGCYFGFT